MLYFKKVILPDEEIMVAEKAIRHFSSKRLSSLDFRSSSTFIMGDKYFLGYETPIHIEITRIRTPLERLLPKLIVTFDKKANFTTYKVRFSGMTLVFIGTFAVGVLFNLGNMIAFRTIDRDFLGIILFSAIIILLTILEFNLTRRKISRAIKKATVETFLS